MHANPQRDTRLDIIRGVAMIIIAVNHVTAMVASAGYDGPRIPSLSDFGQSSAAELFVGLSGYMVGMVYLSRERLAENIFGRMRQLYVFNLIAFCCCAVVIAFADARLPDSSDFYPSGSTDVWRRLTTFLVLLEPPFLLNVLPLYIFLMAGVPAASALLKKSRVFFALALVLGYVAAQLLQKTHPGSTISAVLGWGMDPLAWQLLFYGMMALGTGRFHIRLFNWLSESRWRPIGFVIAFVLAAVLDRWWGTGLIPLPRMDGKANLAPMRLLHAVLTLLTVSSVIVLAKPLYRSRPLLLVAAVGRETLMCYACSIPLTYIAVAVWLHVGASWVYPAVAAAVVFCVILVALRRTPLRRAAAATRETSA